MTPDELAELVTLLGAAGHLLEGIVDDTLAQPAPKTVEGGVQQVADLLVALAAGAARAA